MNPINLIFSGDFAPLVPTEKISGSHFEALMQILERSDLHVTNLECPLTYSQTAIYKSGPALKTEPGSVSLLNQARVTLACLANNHIFDYGEKGIVDTLDVLKKYNIDSIGIVNRTDGQEHWIVKEIRGEKIGFLNYCEHEFSVRDKELLGASGYDPVNAYYDIKALRQKVDWLIVIYHGGNEYYQLPRPELKKNFHYLADLGADSVIGHHTHVFSGYEVYNKKLLVYSLGNFFFPYKGEPDSWHNGLICRLTLENCIKFEFIHILQCKGNYKTELKSPEQLERSDNNLKQLSRIISNNEELRENWKDFVYRNGPGLENSFLYPSKIDRILKKLSFKVYSDRQIRSILNISSCSSLHNLLTDSLKSKTP